MRLCIVFYFTLTLEGKILYMVLILFGVSGGKRMGIFVEQTIRNYLKIKIAILLLKLILIHFLYLDHKDYVKFAELKSLVWQEVEARSSSSSPS